MKEKALFLTSRLPYPPDRGDRVRTFFLLKIFAQIYDITLVSMYDDHNELKHQKYLEQICAEVRLVSHPKVLGYLNLIFAIFSKTPFQVAYYRNHKFAQTLKHLNKTDRFQFVYIHLIRLAQYADIIATGRKILDYTDCISLEYCRSLKHRKGIRKLFFSIESKRTADYEQKVKLTTSERWVISPIDYMALNLNAINGSHIIPNPVMICNRNKDYFLKQKIAFVGNMSVPHNIHAARYVATKVMPNLIVRLPDLTFHIIGANPVPEINELSNLKGTIVHGFVDDLYEELLNCDIFVAPMFFCAGIQNKVLEAMACGLPVVTTKAVMDSLACTNYKELIIADDEKSFTEEILNLLTDIDLRKEIGSNGKEFVVKNYSLASITDMINSRFSDVNNSN